MIERVHRLHTRARCVSVLLLLLLHSIHVFYLLLSPVRRHRRLRRSQRCTETCSNWTCGSAMKSRKVRHSYKVICCVYVGLKLTSFSSLRWSWCNREVPCDEKTWFSSDMAAASPPYCDDQLSIHSKFFLPFLVPLANFLFFFSHHLVRIMGKRDALFFSNYGYVIIS